MSDNEPALLDQVYGDDDIAQKFMNLGKELESPGVSTRSRSKGKGKAKRTPINDVTFNKVEVEPPKKVEFKMPDPPKLTDKAKEAAAAAAKVTASTKNVPYQKASKKKADETPEEKAERDALRARVNQYKDNPMLKTEYRPKATPSSSKEQLQNEIDTVQHELESRRGIAALKQFILATTNLVETKQRKYAITGLTAMLGLRMDGEEWKAWLEELRLKYGSSIGARIPVEMNILLDIIMLAQSVHLANTDPEKFKKVQEVAELFTETAKDEKYKNL